MEDCVNKGRQAKGDMLPNMQGENSNFAKLSENDVLLIRDRLSDGLSAKSLAEQFNVSVDNIYRIKRKDTWRHI